MIKFFRHKGLKCYFETGNKAGIKPEHVHKLSRQLLRLDIARTIHDMNVPGWRFDALTGDLSGHYSIVVNGNWRITFRFEREDVVAVDYLDDH